MLAQPIKQAPEKKRPIWAWVVVAVVYIPLAFLLTTWLNGLEKESTIGTYTVQACSQAPDGTPQFMTPNASTCQASQKKVYGIPLTYKTEYTLVKPRRDFLAEHKATTVVSYTTVLGTVSPPKVAQMYRYTLLSWNFVALIFTPLFITGIKKLSRKNKAL